MSETAISRFTMSRPLALRTLRLRLFLFTFVSLKFPEVFRLTSSFCGVVVLGSRPRSFSGHSILMISAPKAPSQRVAHGPARTQLKSTTRMFSRARGRDMAWFPCCGRTLRSPKDNADKAEHQQCGEPERYAAEHIHRGNGVADRPRFGGTSEPGHVRHHPGDRCSERGADRAYRGQGGRRAAMFGGIHAVHRPRDEMHIVNADAGPH